MIKNVVIIASSTQVKNGAVQVAVNQAKSLAEKGINVFYFAGCGEPVETVDEALKSSPLIKVISCGYYPTKENPSRLQAILLGIWNFGTARKFRELLSTLDPQDTVLHFHSWSQVTSPSVLREAVRSDFRVFITLHDYRLACPEAFLFNYPARKICRVKPMSLKCLLCNCDMRHYSYKLWRYILSAVQNFAVPELTNGKGRIGYIFINEFSRKILHSKIPAHKNEFVVRNPIYFKDRFRIEAENNSVFLFIGRISEEKGIRQFCKAVHNTGVKAVAIGDGDYRDELARAYPEIVFTGWQDKSQILGWLEKTRCLIFPSLWYEVSPLVPCEVNAYGIPYISYDTTAATENASFVYHNDEELEGLIKHVSSSDIKQLSVDIYNNFDEGETTDYADNLLKVYSASLS